MIRYCPSNWNPADDFVGFCDICAGDPDGWMEDEDGCCCPECPQCGSVGDPVCYTKHYMHRTIKQIERKAEHDVSEVREMYRDDEFFSLANFTRNGYMGAHLDWDYDYGKPKSSGYMDIVDEAV